ncbi:hypothetical protein [Streptomyces sp. NBC_01363]|uniref:hypothetical protein n=1 Tax=Streptomyces sp. NBC_01363 TaxID=2903840 RepID=UPI0022514527|nr:hypothetical protein [Streptomyces sp. NBC_01363]MCX4731802.1 hypothetical protein [Streptomyces sp. NBC_01363]
MFVKSGRMRRSILGATAAVALLAGAVSCGGDGDDPAKAAWEQSVLPEQLCGGAAVSAEAGKALKVITGSSRFEASGEESTVAHSAAELSGVFSLPASEPVGDHGDVCRIFTPVGRPYYELRVAWRLSYQASSADDKPPTGFSRLRIGEWAVAAPDEAYVRFDCRSRKLPGSEQSPAHIEMNVERMRVLKKPEDDIEALKRAYAAVTHSVSLAMAKELDCEGHAGLGTRPALDPA